MYFGRDCTCARAFQFRKQSNVSNEMAKKHTGGGMLCVWRPSEGVVLRTNSQFRQTHVTMTIPHKSLCDNFNTEEELWVFGITYLWLKMRVCRGGHSPWCIHRSLTSDR